MREITLYRTDFKRDSEGKSYFDYVLGQLGIDDPDEKIDEITIKVEKFETL